MKGLKKLKLIQLDLLFIIGDWNAKVERMQKKKGYTWSNNTFGPGKQSEAG